MKAEEGGGRGKLIGMRKLKNKTKTKQTKNTINNNNKTGNFLAAVEAYKSYSNLLKI